VRRRVPLDGTDNTRDLGGYPVPGGHTAWGRTFRSDAPMNLSPKDVEALRKLGITTHIDLRTADEVGRWPSAAANLEGIRYHHVDLCACMQMMPESEEGVAASYFEMTGQAEPMARVFRIIAKAEGGLLFHCAAGKDRTGVVAAILLMLAGAERADLLADYILTAAYMREPVKKLFETDPDIPYYVLTPRVEYMEAFLDRFLAAYGSAQGYLEGIGVSAEEIKSITQRLTFLTSSYPI
jgi:protein-tyrosine phosphatase